MKRFVSIYNTPTPSYAWAAALTRANKPKEAEDCSRESVKLKHLRCRLSSALRRGCSSNPRIGPLRLPSVPEALKYDPESADLHNCLGVAASTRREVYRAEAAYREAIRR